MSYRLGVDIGGTFTDFVVYDEASGELHAWKNLSTPADPSEGVMTGLRTFGKQSEISGIRLGTTVATNALLERRGEPFFLVSGPGMADLAAIGNQSRPDIFDLEIKRMGGLQAGVLEVSARVRVITEANSGMEYCGITGPVRDSAWL